MRTHNKTSKAMLSVGSLHKEGGNSSISGGRTGACRAAGRIKWLLFALTLLKQNKITHIPRRPSGVSTFLCLTWNDFRLTEKLQMG